MSNGGLRLWKHEPLEAIRLRPVKSAIKLQIIWDHQHLNWTTPGDLFPTKSTTRTAAHHINRFEARQKLPNDIGTQEWSAMRRAVSTITARVITRPGWLDG